MTETSKQPRQRSQQSCIQGQLPVFRQHNLTLISPFLQCPKIGPVLTSDADV